MDAMHLVNSKLDALLKKYTALQAENNRLRATIDGQNKAIQRLNKKVQSLDNGMVSVHLGNTNINEEDKEHMRRQLDVVITEIDKILHTLND